MTMTAMWSQQTWERERWKARVVCGYVKSETITILESENFKQSGKTVQRHKDTNGFSDQHCNRGNSSYGGYRNK